MEINGLRIQNINTITDKRGSFTRFYDSQDFLTENLDINQINLSVSLKKGTLRGMHFQVSGPPENKYVNIISGSIFLHGLHQSVKTLINTPNFAYVVYFINCISN
jgi:dTDP-4-dehydrorhamnose 3,5-epimerase